MKLFLRGVFSVGIIGLLWTLGGLIGAEPALRRVSFQTIAPSAVSPIVLGQRHFMEIHLYYGDAKRVVCDIQPEKGTRKGACCAVLDRNGKAVWKIEYDELSRLIREWLLADKFRAGNSTASYPYFLSSWDSNSFASICGRLDEKNLAVVICDIEPKLCVRETWSLEKDVVYITKCLLSHGRFFLEHVRGCTIWDIKNHIPQEIQIRVYKQGGKLERVIGSKCPTYWTDKGIWYSGEKQICFLSYTGEEMETDLPAPLPSGIQNSGKIVLDLATCRKLVVDASGAAQICPHAGSPEEVWLVLATSGKLQTIRYPLPKGSPFPLMPLVLDYDLAKKDFRITCGRVILHFYIKDGKPTSDFVRNELNERSGNILQYWPVRIFETTDVEKTVFAGGAFGPEKK